MPRRRHTQKRGRKPAGAATNSLRQVKKQPYIGEGFSLYLHHGTGRYYLAVYSERKKKLEFQSLKTMNLQEAVELARTIYAAAADQQKRLAPFIARHIAPSETLEHAFELALAKKLTERRLNPEQEAITKRHWNYFLTWMRDNCPSVVSWAQLTDVHIEAYIADLKRKTPARGPRAGAIGMKPSSISRYMHPITMTSSVMHKLQPELYRLHHVNHMVPRAGREPKKYLTAEQSIKLYQWAKANCRSTRQYAVVAIALGCFAGLRIKEIVNLTLADVDIASGTLTVRVSKTEAGERVIPLTAIALDAWKDYVSELKVIPMQNVPVIDLPYTRISYKVKELLKLAAVALNDPDYAMCAPREALRKSFANLMEEAEVPEKYQRALFGHAAPDSILHEHYREDPAVLPNDMNHVKARKLDKLRTRAVVFIDQLIAEQIAKHTFSTCVSPNEVDKHTPVSNGC
jgi:integrase